MASLYDTDFVLWTEWQTPILERLAAAKVDDGLDYTNLADEIGSMGKSLKREVRRRVRAICETLLRVCSGQQEADWETALFEQRMELLIRFQDSPSLRAFAAQALPAAYVQAKEIVEIQIGKLVAHDQPWSIDEILDYEYPLGVSPKVSVFLEDAETENG